VPNADRLPPSLHTDVKIISGMLLQTGYCDESNWLWMVASSPRECGSVQAKAALRKVV
jgi:hypothetical protein